MQNIAQRLKEIRRRLRLSQDGLAKRMGYSRTYISLVERSKSEVSARFLKETEILERVADAKSLMPTHTSTQSGYAVRETAHLASEPANTAPADNQKPRRVRVLSMIQAGNATSYEELPQSWDDTTEYDGADPGAFALRVVGDSMEPRFYANDLIIVSPQYPATNGELVVARLKNDGGALFKKFHYNEETKVVTLSSYNEKFYDPIKKHRDEFDWIFRVTEAKLKNIRT